MSRSQSPSLPTAPPPTDPVAAPDVEAALLIDDGAKLAAAARDLAPEVADLARQHFIAGSPHLARIATYRQHCSRILGTVLKRQAIKLILGFNTEGPFT